MSHTIVVPVEQVAQRPERLIWLVAQWPAEDRRNWIRNRLGKGLEGRDNPAVAWSARTTKNNENGYGRYLAWLDRADLLIEDEEITERVSPERVASYTASLKSRFSSVSVGATVAALCSAARALCPDADWSWLSRRSTRLKLKAKPSRDKRHAIQHTLDLYGFGKRLMDTAERAKGKTIAATQRYQSGLIIALLAARPLRIRNFQAITIGESLRWDGARYWLVFTTDDTKMHTPVEEPLPDDLIPYLEAFLKTWRPILLRQTRKFGGEPTHRRLWVDRAGCAMKEATLRSMINRYTRKEFGTAVWPHLFRDCLLTSVAIDQPDLMRIGATLLGHTSSRTSEKHYNQARMLDASRRYGATIFELREALLAVPEGEQDGSDR
jgi:integrase/recombinase XerD